MKHSFAFHNMDLSFGVQIYRFFFRDLEPDPSYWYVLFVDPRDD